MAKRIGLIGYGFIGSELYRRIAADRDRFDIAFIHNRSRERLAGVAKKLILGDLGDAQDYAPDIIVEVATPEVTRHWGEHFLAFADYMPLSLTALADDGLRAQLIDAAGRSGYSLLIPHGALVGMDSLVEWRAMWREVTIAFRKPPTSLGLDPASLDRTTTVFEGSVREIAARYPHNVNAMVACALATVGLDRCHARLVADPGIDHLELAVDAAGTDGSLLSIRRQQAAVGVSGSEMAEAVFRSVLRATGLFHAIEYV
ncbi:MAG: DUF108 domain-containing protein [Sphingobium sp.]